MGIRDVFRRYGEIQAADADWKWWIAPTFIALALIGGLFEASGRNPLFAIVLIGLLCAIVMPIRRRQLRRRVEERKARKLDDTDA